MTASTIPTPRAVAVALNGMTGYPKAIRPFLPFVLTPRTGTSAADRESLSELARVYLHGGGTGTPEERAFQVARTIVVALTPGRIGELGDGEEAQLAAWAKVVKGNGYYSGPGSPRPASFSYPRSPWLVTRYRTATGDYSALL